MAGEQYGFIGCTLIVLLLFLITFECIRMSLRAKDLAGKIICCGVGSIVSIQSFINICVATGLAPNTGTPLPFVSYGLTSLISLFMGMGLVLNVGLQSSAYNKELQKKWSEIGYLLSERGILMTRKEPVKNHVRSGNPSRGQASRAAHTASKGTKRTSTPSDGTVSARRKAQNTRMKRMRRKRIRNTIFLLLLLIVLCTAGGLGVYMLKGGDFSHSCKFFQCILRV